MVANLCVIARPISRLFGSWLLGNAFVFGDDVELLMGSNPTANTTSVGATSSANASAPSASAGAVADRCVSAIFLPRFGLCCANACVPRSF